MNYIISKLNKYNVEDYVRVNSLAWKQSYKGIVDKNFLDLINTEEEIQKSIKKCVNSLDEIKGKGFGKILYNKAIEKLKIMGYKDIIIACLKDNSSNEFYKHMGGKLVNTNLLKIYNQELIENIYLFENI